ncbi:MAG TPA: hypothetical protein VM711_10190 [Sphingomicrobium sp.]|nr:hypothetical protein [Sphingomicrobium sp.]
MRPRSNFTVKLARWHEWLVYLGVALLFVTGIGWLLLDRYGKVTGEFGQEPSHFLPWLLLAHGTAAYFCAIVVAMLLPVHVRLGWNSGRNKKSGLTLILVSLFLTLSGLGLYYSTSEQLRKTTSLTHWVVGMAFPLALIMHLIRRAPSRSLKIKGR